MAYMDYDDLKDRVNTLERHVGKINAKMEGLMTEEKKHLWIAFGSGALVTGCSLYVLWGVRAVAAYTAVVGIVACIRSLIAISNS